MPAQRNAVIVVGGIAGLASAVALHRAGWNITVLERSATVGEVGAGITMMQNALRALEALGVGDAVLRAGRVELGVGTRTPTGKWLMRLDSAELADRFNTATLGIHRATLHQVLESALPGDVLRTGAEVFEVSPGTADELAEVRWVEAGREQVTEAELVVAADGLNSRTRSDLWPDAPTPAYIGSTAWRAVTTSASATEPTASITWGPGAEFGVFPLGDGRTYWYGAIKAPAQQRSADELAEVSRHFATWHPPIPDLLAATDPTLVLRHDLYGLPAPLDSYVRQRVALVGDAAHACRPTWVKERARPWRTPSSSVCARGHGKPWTLCADTTMNADPGPNVSPVPLSRSADMDNNSPTRPPSRCETRCCDVFHRS